MPVVDLGRMREEALALVKQQRLEQRRTRLSLLDKLLAEVHHPIVCYVTANRSQFGAQIGTDIIRFFHEHLEALGQSGVLGLFLVTKGGNTLAPSRLVTLMREHCKKLVVLVPYMAYSAGTLIALGADEIVMGPMAELGPVDPSVGNQFNPTPDVGDVPGSKLPVPRPRLPISVEDVAAYLALAREKAGLGEGSNMVEAFKALTEKIHPLALGNIHRQHMLIRRLVKRLLAMHMNAAMEKEKIDQITETLTEKLYAHEYVITREEARDEMQLKVSYPTQLVEAMMWTLYKAYEEHLLLEQEIDLAGLLGGDSRKYAILDVALIESKERLHVHSYRGWFIRKSAEEINVELERAGWEDVPALEKSLAAAAS